MFTMLSDRKNKLLHILAKFPQTHIDDIILKLNNDSLTLDNFFLQLNIKEEIEKCKKDFLAHRITYLTYYLTIRGLHELSAAKDNYFISQMEEKSFTAKQLTSIDLNEVTPVTIYSMIPVTKTYRFNEYRNIYNEIKDVHCIAYREPDFKNFTNTTIKFNNKLCHLIHDNDTPYLYLYLLANLHHHLNMFFDPKVKFKLALILDVYKENRFSSGAEIYAAKSLILYIKKIINPEFKMAIKDSDYEVMSPFYDSLHQDFDDFYLATSDYIKIIQKLAKKEWDLTTKLFNANGNDTKLITKLILKLAALDYFRDLMPSNENFTKNEVVDAIHKTFGKDIFDSSFIGKTNLEKRIDEWSALRNLTKVSLFREDRKIQSPKEKNQEYKQRKP